MIKTLEGLRETLANVEASPVAVFFATSEDDKDFNTYESVAKQLEGIQFVHITAPEAREEYKLSGDVKVVLFTSFDSKTRHFEGPLAVETLTQFL